MAQRVVVALMVIALALQLLNPVHRTVSRLVSNPDPRYFTDPLMAIPVIEHPVDMASTAIRIAAILVVGTVIFIIFR